MAIEFDLISDLHLVDNDFDWSGQATSGFCLVLGDIALDRKILVETMKKIADNYVMVMYIDGNLELKNNLTNLDHGYQTLVQDLKKIKNLNFMYDNMIVLNDVAFVGCNGWWTFDFHDQFSGHDAEQWYCRVVGHPCDTTQISLSAINDLSYLHNSIKKLQQHNEIRHIVIGTHTVPRLDLIQHNLDFVNNIKLNVMGNQLLDHVRIIDRKNKIHTWCFGHYHGTVDRIIDNVRYVNNCRGRKQGDFLPYYPKRIVIN